MIPIYRAFSETFDKYILGVPYFSDGRYYMLVDDCNKNNNIGSGSYPIDETTLAIHFPDMLDSQGNKIFASLQEDGKGGDIVEIKQPYRITQTHTGDNIPMGSYTEPLEANIEIIISPIIFLNGVVSLYSDIIDEYSYPLRYRLETKDIQMIKDCFQNGWVLDWSNNEDSDKNYIFSKYKLSSDDELVEFCKPKIIGIQQ